MVFALILFLVTYVLMLTLPKYRPAIVLSSASLFIIMGYNKLFSMDLFSALKAVDYNVLLMIGGTMGIVTLFIESKMPMRLAEILITKVPNIQWAVTSLALFAGVISAFVDNVATVLMIAPIGLAISRKLRISPVPVLIAIAVSSNLQGAATLVGDTTSMLLGGFAQMSFFDFFWMNGKLGIFWAVELGAFASLVILLFLFRKDQLEITAHVETIVHDTFPTFLLLATVLFLIIASFLPQPSHPLLQILFSLKSGLICLILCLIGVFRSCIRNKSYAPLVSMWHELDKDTLMLLFGLFIVIEGIRSAGIIDAIAQLFYRTAGDNPFLLYTIVVFASVFLSAFIDNIPYVATMLPVVQSVALLMNDGAGIEPYVFYFGLLSGATLGGNLTPIGASANIAAIGILRKHGETVRLQDFLKIGVPFTLAAVLVGYVFIWFVWGM